MSRSRIIGFGIVVALMSIGAAECRATYALFDSSTDTISVSGGTVLSNAVTFEATVLFTSPPPSTDVGHIFNEWTNGQEDKALGLSGSSFSGFTFGVTPASLSTPFTLTLDQWHHVAFVYDGAEQRLYVDGVLVASQAASGSIANGIGNPFIGAIFRDGSVQSSFLGYIDTLRISDDARYTGTSFTPPVGDLSSDANTVLLYNFDEAPGSATVTDLSGNGHTGTLGTGFAGATLPQLTDVVPEPNSVWLFGLGAVALVSLLRGRRGNGQS